KNEGVTILISSHKLDEISKIATNIGIIHEGKLIKKIAGGQLEDKLRKSLILDGKDKASMKSILSEAGYRVLVGDEELDNGSLPLEICDEVAVNNPEKIASFLVNIGHPPSLLKVEKEDLESYFLRIIKESGGDL